METINTLNLRSINGNNEIIVRISYNKVIRGINANIEDDLKLKMNDNLENAFQEYKKRKKIRNITNIKITNYFYLEKDNILIPLNGNDHIALLNLQSGDKIIISNTSVINKDIIYNIKKPKNKIYYYFNFININICNNYIYFTNCIFIEEEKKSSNK